MDVKDRAARVDILTLTAPISTDPANSSTPAATSGSFADSLQKSQLKCVVCPAAPPQASPASNGSLDGAAIVDSAAVGGDENPPADIEAVEQLLTQSLLAAITGETSVDEDADSEEVPSAAAAEINSAAQQFLASVAAAANLSAPQVVTTNIAAPAGLADAISAVAERTPATLISKVPSLDPVLSRMPAGLQAGLTGSQAIAASATTPAALSDHLVVPTPVADASSIASLPNSTATSVDAARLSEVKTSPPAAPASSEDASSTDETQARASELAGVAPLRLHAAAPASSFVPAERIETVSQDQAPRLNVEKSGASPTGSASIIPTAEERDPSAEMPPWSAPAASLRGDRHAEAVASQAPPSHVQPTIIDQLQPALHRAATTQQPLSILLRPPELGPVRIDVSQQGGQLSARLEAESTQAHRLLTDSLPQLREILAPLGVAADQVQVVRMETATTTEAGWRADGQADAGNSGRGQDAPSQQSSEPEWIDEPPRDDSAAPGVQTRTAINLRI